MDALRVGVGAPLPTNSHYLRTAGVTAGTMQRAMATLAEQGAVTVTSHGARGRVVESIDVGRAWVLAGLAPLRLLLPPDGPVEIDVLAESLADELTALGLPHTMRHLRGGARRVRAVREGTVDVAVVSAGMLDAASAQLGEAPTRLLAAGTYYGRERLVSVRRASDVDVRVAIDPDSPDHVRLTEAAYPRSDGYRYVEQPFPDVPAAVLRRQVDLGIWHLARSVIPPDLAGLQCDPLSASPALEVWSAISAAALVGSRRRPELVSVLATVGLSGLVDSQQRRIDADGDR